MRNLLSAVLIFVAALAFIWMFAPWPTLAATAQDRRCCRPQGGMAELLAGIRVVVVDDHDDSRELLEQALRLHGASVTGVATAAGALEAIAGADVVITDLALPGEDGIWLLEQVNRLARPIPVIVVSGYAEVQHDRLAAAPFARKLLKPIDPDAVCRALREVLRVP